MTCLLWVILKEMIQMNFFTKQKRLTDLEKELMITSGGTMEGRDDQGIWDQHTHTAVFKVDNQQGTSTAQGTVLNGTRQPGWEGSLGRMDTCIYKAESLHCAPKTITTLLIDYSPKSNKKF